MMREFLSSNLSVPMSSLIMIKFILCTFVHYKINLCSVLIKIAKLPARDTGCEFLCVIISHEMKKRFK